MNYKERAQRRSELQRLILKSIREGECVTCEEIRKEVPDCSPGALGFLTKDGLIEVSGSNRGRYKYKLTRKGLTQLEEGERPAGLVPHRLTGGPSGHYSSPVEVVTRSGAMDAFKLPSRRQDGLHLPSGQRFNLCSKEGK